MNLNILLYRKILLQELKSTLICINLCVRSRFSRYRPTHVRRHFCDIHPSIIYAYHRKYLNIINVRKLVSLWQFTLLKKTCICIMYEYFNPVFKNIQRDVFSLYTFIMYMLLTVCYTSFQITNVRSRKLLIWLIFRSLNVPT